MNNETLTIEEINTAAIGTSIKAIGGAMKATRISIEKWSVEFATGMKATMHHSRIVPVVHTRTLTGKEINHVDHVGYVFA